MKDFRSNSGGTPLAPRASLKSISRPRSCEVALPGMFPTSTELVLAPVEHKQKHTKKKLVRELGVARDRVCFFYFSALGRAVDCEAALEHLLPVQANEVHTQRAACAKVKAGSALLKRITGRAHAREVNTQI